MAKAIEELTIAELQRIIKVKRRMARKAPALRKERAKLRERLAEIEKELAIAGLRRGRGAAKKGPGRNGRRRAAVRGRIAKAAPKVKTAVRRGKLVAVAGRRLPRGSVQNAILSVLGAEQMSPAAVSKAIERTLISGVSPKSVVVSMDKLRRQGKILRIGRALYKKA